MGQFPGNPEQAVEFNKCAEAFSPLILSSNFDQAVAVSGVTTPTEFLADRNYKILGGQISCSVLPAFSSGPVGAVFGWTFDPQALNTAFIGGDLALNNNTVILACAASGNGSPGGADQAAYPSANSNKIMFQHPYGIFVKKGVMLSFCIYASGATNLTWATTLYLMPTGI